MGGDEFAVLIKNCPDIEYIKQKVDFFIKDFIVCTENEESRQIFVSIGSVLFPARDGTFMELYQQADDALYRAKQQGKGRLEVVVLSECKTCK